MDLGTPDRGILWRRIVFTTLFRLWVKQGEKRTLTSLAEELQREGAKKMSLRMLSRFVHREAAEQPASWTRQPPDWLLFNMLRRTGRRLELTHTGVHIVDPVATRAGEGSVDADRSGADDQ